MKTGKAPMHLVPSGKLTTSVRALEGVRQEIRALGMTEFKRKDDLRRLPCASKGCARVHLKGSDFCYEHDVAGERPRRRRTD